MTDREFWTRRKFLAVLGAGAVALPLAGSYSLLRQQQVRSAAPQYQGNIAALSDLGSEELFDVCIIGSGPAGASLGIDLAAQGLRTLMIESGPDSFSIADARLEQLQQFTCNGPIDYPLRESRVRAIGGTSNIWTGRCSRFHPLDFESNAYTPPEAPWPVRYAELSKYYAKAERTLRVAGGDLSEYHAPREEGLPLAAQMDISGLRSLATKSDIVLDDSPTSVDPSNGGPLRVATSLLPYYSTLPGAALLGNATVTRLLIERGSGRVSGVEVRDLDRRTRVVRARAYVVACGAVESARLLLLSRSENHPSGIGNAHDLVGRYFMEHPNVMYSGMISHTWSTLSPQYELARSHQFYESFKRRGLGSLLLVFSQSWVFPDDLTDPRASRLLRRLIKAQLRIGATLELEPQAANRVRLSDDRFDYFGNPVPDLHFSFSDTDAATMQESATLIQSIFRGLGGSELEEMPLSWSHHHSGTCRMGDNPRTSVLDRNLRVHDCANLYVAGSAGFVTCGAAHPTLLITALSHRLAEHLVGALNDGALPIPRGPRQQYV